MMTTMKKTAIATLLGATAIFTAAVTANAEVITSADKKFTMETPNDSWKEVSDQDTKMTLTNGTDYVTVKCFDAEEAHKDLEHTLPMPTIAHDEFEEEFLAYYSTDKDVYVITGLAAKPADIKDVRFVVNSIQLADHQSKNENAPKEKEQKDDPQGPTRTGNSSTIYYLNSNSVTVYEYSDGKWRNDDGVEFWRTTEGQWANSEGSVLYDYVPEVQPENEKTGNSMTLYFENGNTVGPVYEYKNGQWLDGDGVSYTNCGDYWQSSQGSRLYDHELSVEEMRALHGDDAQNGEENQEGNQEENSDDTSEDSQDAE